MTTETAAISECRFDYKKILFSAYENITPLGAKALFII